MSAVILDISRLISRLRYSTPSGVDRVEMAYARGLLAHTLYGLATEFALNVAERTFAGPRGAADPALSRPL